MHVLSHSSASDLLAALLASLPAPHADHEGPLRTGIYCVNAVQLRGDLAALFPGFVFLGGGANVLETISGPPALAPDQVCSRLICHLP